jgi:succinate-semialdehyde dehydrogenase/glutarate-semialdehyde dehydrogenase
MSNHNLTLKNPHLLQTGLLIDNKFINNRLTFQVINPATNSLIIAVAKATTTDVDDAIQSANRAFKIWKNTNISKRITILKKWHDLIIENLEDLAVIVTLECGKPLNEARAEVLHGASYVEWYSEEIKRINGDIIPSTDPQQRLTVTKEPVGICAIITPWNFPHAMIMRKIAPAIACGCSVIVKPASQTPLSALAIGYLAIKAGFIDGLFNIVMGDSTQIGNQLTASDLVHKLSFTGSTAIGKQLYAQSATTLKKLSLELGGNAPFIVLDDANIIKAVDGLIKAKFRNAGQTCICANRIFLHQNIKQQFITELLIRVRQLNVGNGLDVGVNVGPLINEHAVINTIALIEDAVANGATLVAGGTVHNLGGNFFNPTILTDCTSEMRLFNEEIFAPIIAIYEFSSDDTVVELANKTEYGLASYFYAKDITRITKIAENLQFGMVGINTGLLSGVNIPFGGIKHSGFGREGGKYGIDEYLNLKYVCTDIE